MPTWLKATLAAVAAAATFAGLFFGRHFFVSHAVLVAIAVGALVFTTLGTTERLSGIYRRKGPRSMRRPDD
jgi:xanthine/uracil permease